MKIIKAAIIGASGYTGSELVRILINHPNVEIVNLVANNNAGQDLSELYANFSHLNLPTLQNLENVDFGKIDVVFCCLPHTTSQQIIAKISQHQHLKIIDLSADFRLKDINSYESWYETKHLAANLQDDAVYGLSEIYENQIKKSSLIACPGCYPTSILLPLIPLLENKLVNKNTIIVDAKSGFSGAGKKLLADNLFCEINNSVKAYSVGKHRHLSEIEQELGIASNDKVEISFTPHILPINRGIISTIYLDLCEGFSISDLYNCLEIKYQNNPFVNLNSSPPEIRDVIGTNLCSFNINQGRNKNKAVIISVIDNLVKGASGQAVQNMNLIFGFEEKTGLTQIAMLP